MHLLVFRNVVFVFIATLQILDCQELGSQGPPRSVNLALETVLEFDNQENSADIKIIDKVQNFLKRVKKVIKRNQNFRRTGSDDEAELTFTDFIKSVLVILSSYSDDDLEDVADVAGQELRKYHYKGCKFYELVENRNVRRLMADKLAKMKTRPGKELRRNLKAMLRTLTDENRGFKEKMISRYLDSLYNEKDTVKFASFLNELALYKRKSKRANLDLTKIIRRGLRSVIFDHYSKLDVDTRTDMRIKLETFWRHITANQEEHNVWRFEKETKIRHPNKETAVSSIDKGKVRKKVSKKKRSRTKDRGEVVPDKMTKRSPRFSFITLYPEVITFLKRHKLRKGHAKQRHAAMDDMEEAIYRAMDHTKSMKRVLSDGNYTINTRNLKSDESNKEIEDAADDKIRHKYVKGKSLKTKTTTEVYVKIKSDIRKNVFDTETKITGESNEGLAIEAFSNERNKPSEVKPIRKSNDNDTLAATRNQTAKRDSNEVNLTSNYIQRIKNLETELKVVKQHIEHIQSTTKYDENKHYDILDFWERTTSSEKENITKSAETKRTTATTNKRTTKKNTFTTKDTKKASVRHKSIAEPKTTKSVNKTVSDKPNAVFRSNDDPVPSVKIKPKTTNPTTGHTIERVELKSRVKGTPNTSTTLAHKNTMKNASFTKPDDTSAAGVEDKYLSDAEVETYLNDTQMLEDDLKSQMVKNKVVDDLNNLVGLDDAQETTTEPLSVAKIGTTDVLAILDEGDDII